MDDKRIAGRVEVGKMRIRYLFDTMLAFWRVLHKSEERQVKRERRQAISPTLH